MSYIHGARLALVVGAAWLTIALPLGPGVNELAGASTVRVAAPANGHWSAPVTLFRDNKGASIATISCEPAHFCVATGTEGSNLAGQGIGLSYAAAWSAPVVIDKFGGLTAVSCAPGGPCTAVGPEQYGQGDNTYRFSGGRWAPGPVAPMALGSVSCPTANFCAGVGFLNYASATVFNGTSWSPQARIAIEGASISCPTKAFCAVVGAGQVIYYRDGAWSKATTIDRDRDLGSVSCPSARFCVAVDPSGNALSDVDGKWSTPDYSAPLDRISSLTGVSCPTTTFCVAVDSTGQAYLYNGSRWSSPQTISSNIYFTSVSCPRVNFCAASGQNSFTSPTVAYAVTFSRST